MACLAMLVLLLVTTEAVSSPEAAAGVRAAPGSSVPLDWAANSTGRRFDGIGGLSGGGATSTFLLAYKEPQRSEIMDWMFKPGFGASLNILKVEVGSDDQTTDGCEGCHMRSPTEVDCNRGYEWGLMKEASARNPEIILYGLPWAWAGWLGFGTNSPYTNVTATADYTAKWIECGRDAHGLNISMIGLWNEEPGPVPYILALRRRLDAGGLGHVKIIAPDGGGNGMDAIADEMAANASVKAAVGALGSHYPGSKGTSPKVRAAGVPAWSAEDYSTYSDATGAGCWGRLLVQNMGWDLSATISWYLIGSFARGMDYDSDGLVRAEWPNSGHYELTPMLWTTMHWTRFVQPGWRALPCTDASVPTGRCALRGGGNYAAMASADSQDFAIIVHSFRHNTSKCIRCDPPDWEVAPTQSVSFGLSGLHSPPTAVHAWRSCASWEYPAAQDGWFMQQADVMVSASGSLQVEIEADCMYTFTTVGGVTKPQVPQGEPRSAAFPLPYREDFDGMEVGAEAPYFGDQMGKFETVPAGGGRTGNVSRQQLPLGLWPICNRGHSQPISIIGDMFFEDVEVSADILIETPGVGAGLALRVRNTCFFRGVTPGVYLFVGDATPAIPTVRNPDDPSCGFQGGIPALPNIPMGSNATSTEWKICTNSYCNGAPIATGKLPAGAWGVGEWHRLSLMTVGDNATASMDGKVFWSGEMSVPVGQTAATSVLGETDSGAGSDLAATISSTTTVPQPSCAGTMVLLSHDEMLVGSDYRQVQLQSDPSDTKHCIDACCKDPHCTSWAVATSTGSGNCRPNTACCWLKNGTVATEKQHGTKEVAAGYKPGSAPPARSNCSLQAVVQWPIHSGACSGLQHDESAHDPHTCALNCCKDLNCMVWQVEPDNTSCWRGNPTGCQQTPTKPASGVRPGYDPNHPHPTPPGPSPPPSGPPHPELPFKGQVPTSGWAALVTTLGAVQYDNFELEGRASGGGAVASCGTGAPMAGDRVVSTPCDAPAALTEWEKLPGGQLQLSSTTLCIASGGVLAPCAGRDGTPAGTTAQLVVHDRATGRITTATDTCLDIPGYPGQGGVQWPSVVTNATCGAIPEDSQQFQYHPGTGALRPKASMCVASFSGSENQYRDCCLSVCPH